MLGILCSPDEYSKICCYVAEAAGQLGLNPEEEAEKAASGEPHPELRSAMDTGIYDTIGERVEGLHYALVVAVEQDITKGNRFRDLDPSTH